MEHSVHRRESQALGLVVAVEDLLVDPSLGDPLIPTPTSAEPRTRFVTTGLVPEARAGSPEEEAGAPRLQGGRDGSDGSDFTALAAGAEDKGTTA